MGKHPSYKNSCATAIWTSIRFLTASSSIYPTYIAVNGTIAKAIRPSQYSNPLTQAAWTATIPPSQLRVGKNIIRAFSPVDASETAFVEFRRPFTFQLTQDRLNKLRLSVAKKRD